MLANNNILDNQYKNTQIKKCADMIADVLIRCRHKGAMEATCRSLGALIKNWKESQNWCQQMLTDHLSCMKPEDEISRRSAGVRYLIHAIVTNNKVCYFPILGETLKKIIFTVNFCFYLFFLPNLK